MARTREFGPVDDPTAIADYLSEALATENTKYVMQAIGAAARAKGMSAFARQSGVSRENLYRALNAKNNLSLATIMKVLSALGVQLAAKPRKQPGVRHARMTHQSLMPLSNLKVLRDGESLVLHMAGRRLDGLSQRGIQLIDLLIRRKGKLVHYDVLSGLVKSPRAGRPRHVVRQHVAEVRKFFATRKIGAEITTANGIGYAICEVVGRLRRPPATQPKAARGGSRSEHT